MQSLQAFVPTEWQGTFDLLTAPVAWIPGWHLAMMNFVWYGDTTLEIVLKRVVVLLPMLLVLTGVWVTMASLYTIPFRSNRGRFATAMLTSWWDAGRTTWFYWAGIVQLTVVLVGWVWSLVRLAGRIVVAAVTAAFQSPLRLLDWTSRNYFKPGVPWLAFLALLLWSAVEALIFMYTLQPTLTEVLAGITGFEPDPRVVAPLLWIFLFFLVLGSFACVHALAIALREKNVAGIVQMSFVELFVMFFEVVFLYRELIDAVTPWVAQTTSEQLQLGLVSTLLLASFGWVGVRGMTWFLFGRYGTPALVAVLARETISQGGTAGQVALVPQPEFWKAPVAALKAETEWFEREARKVFALLSLPVLQLVAAAMNFPVVALGSRPLFALPFRNLDEVLVKTPRIGFGKGPIAAARPQPAHDAGGA
ncbi:MAG: hypothetical protein OEY20_11245 [Gemmatimonadota bacterium]|nr:hypothetical protein [Gemmatimonadota bacterium]MDH4351684.1 hypothetical protein [Gemmatimonadota bacterium]MDH5197817.1 hypothetical protein [Gemmatimonadota bacterium]